MKSKNDPAYVVIFILCFLVVLAANLLTPVWKYKTCKNEGLSTAYCVSRLF